MGFKEIGELLAERRDDLNIAFPTLRKAGLTDRTIDRIETGQDYMIKSLFNYLGQLFMLMQLDGRPINDIGELGAYLRHKREEGHFTVLDLKLKVGLNAQQVSAIENGKNYYKSTLERYLSVVNVNVDITSMLKILGNEQ